MLPAPGRVSIRAKAGRSGDLGGGAARARAVCGTHVHVKPCSLMPIYRCDGCDARKLRNARRSTEYRRDHFAIVHSQAFATRHIKRLIVEPHEVHDRRMNIRDVVDIFNRMKP